MVVVVLLSLPLGQVGIVLQQMRKERTVLEQLEKCQPRAAYRYGFVVGLAFARHSSNAPTDKDLAHLHELNKLRLLDLLGSNVTDAGLEHVGRIRTLESLNLSNSRVSDDGLEHLKGLHKLEYLNLCHTQITDVGLEHLKKLINMGYLYLVATHVTDEGIEELRKALPNCDIVWEEEDAPANNQP